MNTTTTKISGEAMQITDEFKDWFEREWASYQDKAISGGKIVSMAWALKGYRALLASKPAVPEGWKLVPVELTEHMLDEADFAMQNHVGDAYTDADGFDGWYQPVWKAILAASPTAPAQPCGIDTTDCEECGTLGISIGANCPRCGTLIARAQSCGDAEQADEAVTDAAYKSLFARYKRVLSLNERLEKYIQDTLNFRSKDSK